MNILFYARNGAAKGIQEAVEKVSFDAEVYRDAVSLMERLRFPLDDPAITVLVADSTEDLDELFLLRHLFCNVRIILVLPDRGPRTISRGHDLHARFLTCIGTDPVEVALVLSKMIERANASAYRGSVVQAASMNAHKKTGRS